MSVGTGSGENPLTTESLGKEPRVLVLALNAQIVALIGLIVVAVGLNLLAHTLILSDELQSAPGSDCNDAATFSDQDLQEQSPGPRYPLPGSGDDLEDGWGPSMADFLGLGSFPRY